MAPKALTISELEKLRKDLNGKSLTDRTLKALRAAPEGQQYDIWEGGGFRSACVG